MTPFHSQRITTLLVEVYKNIMTWPMWLAAKAVDSDTKKFVTTNHAPPSLGLKKDGLLETFQEFEALWDTTHLCSLFGPTVNLSLLQTPTFCYCLASLCIRYRNMHSVTDGGRVNYVRELFKQKTPKTKGNDNSFDYEVISLLDKSSSRVPF